MAFGEAAEFERAELDALHLFHGMIDGEEFVTQQVAARVGQLDFIPGILRMRTRGAGSAQAAQTSVGAPANLLELVVGKAAGNLQPIDFGQARGVPQDAVSELAIGGEQQQAGDVVIETAHGKNAAGKSAQDVAERGASFGIGHGGDDVDRFVQEIVAGLGGLFGEAAGGFDAIVLGIGFGAELGDDDTIDADLSAADQFFGVAAGGDAGAGDNFLEAFEHFFLWPNPNS